MQYSPKLKNAMEEIKAVVKKYDIAAFVVLHTPGFSEHYSQIEPSYSCAKVVEGGIRFRAKSAEIGKEKVNQMASDTLNMLHHLTINTVKHSMNFMDAEGVLMNATGGTHGDGNYTSHDQQNN